MSTCTWSCRSLLPATLLALLSVETAWAAGAADAQSPVLAPALVPTSEPARAPAAGPAPAPARTVELPQSFIEQEGGFRMVGDGLSVSLEPSRLRYLLGRGDEIRVVTVEPVRGNPGVIPAGEAPLPGVVSHFRGRPEEWSRGRPTFGAVRYAALWDGIDLLLEAEGRTLKGTYEVAAGADPGAIRLAHRGADAVTLDAAGRLVLSTAAGELVDAAPVAWQHVAGARQDVPVAFGLRAGEGGAIDVVFELGAYDADLPLLIDPAVIVQCGFLGGAGRDQIVDMDVDAAGNVYLTGFTNSDELTFPEVVGPDLTYNGPGFGTHGDVFVAKLDPTGLNLLYVGFLGGAEYDYASGIEVDDLGRAYISGRTGSPESSFPVVGGPDLTYNSGQDGFVARVSADGTSLEYCGYVGGNSEDRAFDIDVDDLYRAYVVGRSESLNHLMPLTVGPDLTKPGVGSDGFVGRLSPSGGSWEYFGWFGGNGLEDVTGVRADFLGGAWITGWTLSDDLPVVGGLDPTINGGVDTFIARVSPDGTGLTTCGYLGGSASDFPYKPVLAPSGALFVSGYANDAASFPTLVGPDLTPLATGSGFLTKVAANGDSLVWSGFTSTGYGGAIAADEDSRLWFLSAMDNGPFGGTDGILGRVLEDGSGFEFEHVFGGAWDDAYTQMHLVPSALTPGVTEVWTGTFTTLDETQVPVVGGPDLTANGDIDTVVMRVQVGADPWTDLGLAKAGTHGEPSLSGGGTLGPLSPLELTLTNALENTTAWLALGFATVNLPFKGGTFIPDISFPGSLTPLPTDGAGQVVIAGTTPPGSPPGFSFYAQYWIQDPGAAGAPVSASNGLQGTTP